MSRSRISSDTGVSYTEHDVNQTYTFQGSGKICGLLPSTAAKVSLVSTSILTIVSAAVLVVDVYYMTPVNSVIGVLDIVLPSITCAAGATGSILLGCFLKNHSETSAIEIHNFNEI